MRLLTAWKFGTSVTICSRLNQRAFLCAFLTNSCLYARGFYINICFMVERMFLKPFVVCDMFTASMLFDVMFLLVTILFIYFLSPVSYLLGSFLSKGLPIVTCAR